MYSQPHKTELLKIPERIWITDMNKIKVLLIEDDRSISNFITATMDREGYKIMHALNGRRGTESQHFFLPQCDPVRFRAAGHGRAGGITETPFLERCSGDHHICPHQGAGEGLRSGSGGGRLYHEALRHRRAHGKDPHFSAAQPRPDSRSCI